MKLSVRNYKNIDRDHMCISQMKYTNLFLILFGLIASMSGLPAYLNNNGTELFISCGPLYSTITFRSISSYEELGAVGDSTIR